MGSDRLRFLSVWALRIILGLTFMVSGLSKAIDIYGFIFKLEEYAGVWDVAIPFSLMLTMAAFVVTFEFVSGLLLFVGAYRRFVVYALTAFMVVMLCLTLYIWVADPVSDCGCFGDFVILSNSVTFWKNVVICVLLALLWCVNRRVKGFYHPNFQWGALALGSLYCLTVVLYGYYVQPMVDFRSFPVGSRLVANDDDVDDGEFEFVYERDGVKKAFDLDSLPDDSWTFIERKELGGVKNVERGTELVPHFANGEPADVFFDGGSKNYLIITAANPYDINAVMSFYINRMASVLEDTNVVLVEMTGAANEEDVRQFRMRTMSPVEVLVAEPTVIKELARGGVAYVYVEDGIIKWKRTAKSFNYDEFKYHPVQYLNKARTWDWHNMVLLTIMLAAGLFMLYLIDISRKLFRKKRCRNKNISNFAI